MKIDLHPASLLKLALAASALALGAVAQANDSFALDPYSSERLVNLRGKWKFSVGDDSQWASPGFNDSSWSKIDAPNEWEDEGYRNYDGYGWYRKTFTLPARYKGTSMFLYLGRIDDVDEVYLNGMLIGATGRFPTDYLSAYDQRRAYLIPADAIKAGAENLVAVRVYDARGNGGIVSGRLGIYESSLPSMQVNLEGQWRFHVGDSPDWAAPEFDDSNFESIYAPRPWDDQGYQSLDGFAWYRKTFTVNLSELEQTMVLLLGKIDDFDEVYLNGQKVGSSGSMDPPDERDDDVYSQSRNYYFPASLLKETNTIAVRVFDKRSRGGIYEGPLGVISQSRYIEYWETRRKNQSIFDDIRRVFD